MKNLPVLKVGNWFSQQLWFWAFCAALLIWLLLAVGKGMDSAIVVLPVAFGFAALYVIVGIGQMFVISSGPGNIDLSIPMIMTLAAYVSNAQMHGQDSGILVGVIFGVGTGVAFGLLNASLIRFFKMPPMIVTLAVGLIAQSIAISFAKLGISKPGPALQYFATGKVMGIPILPLTLVLISVAIAFFMRRSGYVRTVFAIGQNPLAAYFAGLRTRRTMMTTYILSGFCAGVGGIILSGFQGGASLAMASDYLLISIAAVVLGGTPITGGRATLFGTWSAALFLFLLLSLLNSFQVQIGLRNIITGMMIIAVLILSALVNEKRGRV